MRAYANDTADIVTVNTDRRPVGRGGNKWMFINASTRAFARLVPQDRRYSVRLFAQRFSTRFLRVADALTRRGVAAVTELSAVSLAHALRLSRTEMLGRFSGTPFMPYTRIDQSRWEKIKMDTLVKETEPRLFHALKW